MKKIFIILSVFLLVTGCKNSMLNVEKEKPSSIQTKSVTQGDLLTYNGNWFEIKYPKEFIATPAAGKTDEAKFSSLDGSIEFFVFSPLWGGDPADYLKTGSNEELVNEKTEESGENLQKQITHWETLKAKDGSYYRSFVSIKGQVGTGSDVHKVFGIKYKNNDTYEKYKDAYISFKKSLKQFSD